MKKPILLLFVCLLFQNLVYAQKKEHKIRLKFNEIALSVNQNHDSDALLGFGVGAYSIRPKNRYFSYVWGLEYNKSSKLEDAVYLSHQSNLTDVTYDFHNLLIPLGYRFHAGHKVKFMLSASIFLDLALYTNIEGKRVTSNLDPDNFINETIAVNERADVPPFAFGFLYGPGLSIPINGHDLLLQINRVYSFRNVGDERDSILNFYTRISLGYRWRV